jgi:hypothetical protein
MISTATVLIPIAPRTSMMTPDVRHVILPVPEDVRMVVHVALTLVIKAVSPVVELQPVCAILVIQMPISSPISMVCHTVNVQSDIQVTHGTACQFVVMQIVKLVVDLISNSVTSVRLVIL